MSRVAWLMMTVGAVVSVTGQVSGTRLLAQARVSRDQVMLSDLLPEGASAELREWAEGVRLGRAPQPGATRIFTQGQLLALAGGRPGLEIPAAVLVRREAWGLGEEPVRRALTKACAEVDWSEGQLSLPSEFMTRDRRAEWKLVRLQKSGTKGYRADLRCRDERECGVFAFRILFPRPVADCQIRKGARVNLRAAPMVVPGRTASLVLKVNGMRLTAPVRPLQAAALGQRVAAVEIGTKKVLATRVEGKDLLALAEGP